jgi:hypothetical protein
MNIFNKTNEVIGYFSEAIAVIFSVDEGGHPDFGIQPFTGDINHQRSGKA